MTNHDAQSERGDVSIAIAIILALIILSSTIIISLILARQIRLTQNVIASERALYAADAGIEEGHYKVFKDNIVAPENISDTLDYGAGITAEYDGTVLRHEDTVTGITSACIPRMTGTHRSTVRRLATGPIDCEKTP